MSPPDAPLPEKPASLRGLAAGNAVAVGFSIVYFLAALWQFLAWAARDPGKWPELARFSESIPWLPVDLHRAYLLFTGGCLLIASWELFPWRRREVLALRREGTLFPPGMLARALLITLGVAMLLGILSFTGVSAERWQLDVAGLLPLAWAWQRRKVSRKTAAPGDDAGSSAAFPEADGEWQECPTVRKDHADILLNAAVLAAAGVVFLCAITRDWTWGPAGNHGEAAPGWARPGAFLLLFVGTWLTAGTHHRGEALLAAGQLSPARAARRLRLFLVVCFLFTFAGVLVLVHDLRSRKLQDRLLAELPAALNRVPESFDAGPPIERFRQACAALAGAHALLPAEVEHGLETRARTIAAVFPGSVHTASSLVLAYVSEEPRAPATLQQRELGTPWYRGTAEYRALLALRRTWQQDGDPEVLRTRACYVRACYYERQYDAFRAAVDDLLRICRTVPLPPDVPLLNALAASATGLRRIGDAPREEALWRLLIATCEKAEQQGRKLSLRLVYPGTTGGLEAMQERLNECLEIQKKYTGERK